MQTTHPTFALLIWQVLNHVITGHWDPREAAFAVLNQETPHDVSSTYITIAADLVVSQIAEPIRFVIETKVRTSLT